MMRSFRMFQRVCLEAVLGIKYGGWLNLFIITTIMLMLLSFGVVLGFSLTLKKFASQLGANNEVLIHVKHDTPLKSFGDLLDLLPEVKNHKLITNKEVFQDTKKMWDIELDESFNDMPHTFLIKIDNPKVILPMVKEIARAQIKYIESIEYAPTLIKKIHTVKNALIIGGTLFSLLLATTTFIINFNTIELVIRARKSELKLLNFMGVKGWFIKGPFVIQGLIYALSGSLLSIVCLLMVNYFIQNSIEESMNILELLVPTVSEFALISLILVLTAVLFSITSSLWATNKRLSKY